MKLIPYILYLLLVAFYEVTLRGLTSIYGVPLGLPVFLVLAVALYKQEATEIWFGFAVGLVAAQAQPGLVGWYAMTGAILGSVAVRVRERLNLESPMSRLLLVFGGALAYNVVIAVVNGPEGLIHTIGTSAIPGALYTTVFAWVFFQFKEGGLTPQKLKAMF